ncbi:hypothetical protein [Chenggangzhangella methanolivorans]|uniref:Uncharacterized protein n=1 Tax=Chenggangzhangella methanolivorans TaxID=1437009 RepID=A0A9E6RHG5_9HYPH|nr:hypothetical protein [Chenggangzhangella methanolivorans]QZO01102.1 hypothetical protein K6K41_05880 [Chenggangzhangella methanolivorans]
MDLAQRALKQARDFADVRAGTNEFLSPFGQAEINPSELGEYRRDIVHVAKMTQLFE